MNRSFFVFLLICTAVLLAGLTHWHRHFIDYPVYESAGKKVLAGQFDKLYDRERNAPGGYYYSFLFACLMALFAAGGIVGKFVFLLLFLLAYAWVLFFSLRHGRVEPKRLSLLMLGTAYAVNDALMNANIGILLFALVTVAYELSERRPHVSGTLLSIAITMKIYPAFIFFYFIWRKSWKLCATTLFLTAFFYFGLPIVSLGWTTGNQVISDQLFVLTRFGEHWPYDSLVFQNLPATAMRYAAMVGVDPQVAFSASLVIALSLIVGLLLPSFIRRRRRPDKQFEARLFCLCLALIPILCPVSWYNMALFYAPVLAWIIERGVFDRRRGYGVALVLYTILFCLTTPDIVGRSLNDTLERYSIPFIGIVAIVMAYVVDLVREKTSGELPENQIN